MMVLLTCQVAYLVLLLGFKARNHQPFMFIAWLIVPISVCRLWVSKQHLFEVLCSLCKKLANLFGSQQRDHLCLKQCKQIYSTEAIVPHKVDSTNSCH